MHHSQRPTLFRRCRQTRHAVFPVRKGLFPVARYASDLCFALVLQQRVKDRQAPVRGHCLRPELPDWGHGLWFEAPDIHPFLLEKQGYQTAVVASDYGYTDWRDAAYYFRPFTINPNPLEGVYLSVTFLSALYEIDRPLIKSLRNFLPIPAYSTRRDHILYAFDAMDELAMIESPKFVFVHIIAPHPPFVIDKDGQQLKTNRPYGGLGGTSTTPEGYQHDYIGQLEYLNREILKAIDIILVSNDKEKVIILQGDHGGASLLSGDIETSCLFERASILNAYYFSGGNTQALYPSITPVNSFRVVFNKYFGIEMPLLLDKTYFSNLGRPLKFTDISNRIEKTCTADK